MRKVKYLVAALLLMGATTTFTSCIDNDEPAGITELRGAKAELLKAKAVVEQANAAMKLAEAEYQKALAAHEQANADYRQAEVEMQKLQNELQAAENEAEKARLEAEIANYKNQMEEAALKHQTEMVRLQGVFAEQQRQYELILKQIQIAQELGSDQEKVDLAYLRNEVAKYYAQLFGGQYLSAKGVTIVIQNPDQYIVKEDGTVVTIDGGETVQTIEEEITTVYATRGEMPDNAEDSKLCLAKRVYEAQEKLYNATLEKTYGYTEDNTERYIPYLEVEKEIAEDKVAAAEAALKKLEEFLATDETTADWRQEIADLEAEIEALKIEKDQKQVDVDAAKASEEYLAAAQAYKGIKKNNSDDFVTGDENDGRDANGDVTITDENEFTTNGYKTLGTAQKLTVAEFELKDALENKDVDTKVQEFEVETTDAVLTYVNNALEAAESSTTAFDDFKVAEVSDIQDNFELKDAAVVVKENSTLYNRVREIAKWVKYASKASADVNEAAAAEMNLEKAEKAVETATEAYNDAVDLWEIAKRAQKGDDSDKVPTDVVTAGAKAYNTAYASVVANVEAYNKAYDAAYDAAYDKLLSNKKTAKYDEAYLSALTKLITTASSDSRFDQVSANNKYNSADTEEQKSVTYLEYLVNTYAQETTDKEGNKVSKSQNAAALLSETSTDAQNNVNAYFETTAGKDEIKDLESQAHLEVIDATGKIKVDAVSKALETLNKSVTTVNEKYNYLGSYVDNKDIPTTAPHKEKNVLGAYQYLAKYTYGREVDVDKTKINAASITGYDSKVAAEGIFYIVDKDEATHYKAIRSQISEENITAITKVKINSDFAKEAWDATSVTAFGVTGRAIEPTRDELRKIADEAQKNIADYGAMGAMIAAEDAVTLLEEQIAAKDDLAKLVTDLTKLQSDYNAAVEAAKTKAYGEEIKAYEDAVAANDKAKAAFEAEDVKIEAVKVEVYELKAKIEAYGKVYDQLVIAVKRHLGIEWPTLEGDDSSEQPTYPGEDGTENEYKYDYVNFEEALKMAVDQAKLDVASAQHELAVAEAALEKAQNDAYDSVADAQFALDLVSAQYARVEAQYNEATANLAKALEIMAETAE